MNKKHQLNPLHFNFQNCTWRLPSPSLTTHNVDILGEKITLQK